MASSSEALGILSSPTPNDKHPECSSVHSDGASSEFGTSTMTGTSLHGAERSTKDTDMNNVSEGKSIVKMSKDKEWWLWRGFLSLTRNWEAETVIDWHFDTPGGSFYWKYIKCDDVMDLETFEEETAFPSLKPNIDLFGVPPKSRSQRGWYHVHHPLCQLCLGAQPESALPSPEASAALRLPAEILHMIVESVSEQEQSGRWISLTGPMLPVNKRPPWDGRVALVCRHWASVCLHEKYWTPYTLHGNKDVRTLRALVSAPGSNLTRSINGFHNIVYRLNGTDCPWLHLLPDTYELLPEVSFEDDGPDFTLVGPLGGGLKTMRSIHAYLPRRPPSWFSYGIKDLTLEDIHFSRFNDLEHTLGELPVLEYFKGSRLSWAGTPDTCLPQLPAMRRRIQGMDTSAESTLTVTLTECTNNVEALRLIVHPVTDISHWPSLYPMFHSLVPNASQSPIKARCKSARLRQSQTGIWYDHVEYTSSFLHDDDYYFHVTITDSRPVHIAGLHPVRLIIQLEFPGTSPPIYRAFTWANWATRFDQTILAQFPAQSITFCDHFSIKDSSAYWRPLNDKDRQFVIENMPRSCAAGIISFVKPFYL